MPTAWRSPVQGADLETLTQFCRALSFPLDQKERSNVIHEQISSSLLVCRRLKSIMAGLLCLSGCMSAPRSERMASNAQTEADDNDSEDSNNAQLGAPCDPKGPSPSPKLGPEIAAPRSPLLRGCARRCCLQETDWEQPSYTHKTDCEHPGYSFAISRDTTGLASIPSSWPLYCSAEGNTRVAWKTD